MVSDLVQALRSSEFVRFVLGLAALSLTVLCGFFTSPAEAQLGRRVDNTATVSLDVNGTPLSFNTNTATFVIQAFESPSTIEFFRYAPASSSSVTTHIQGSDYLPGGLTIPGVVQPGNPGDPFVSIGPARTSGGLIVDVSGPVTLSPASSFVTGELMFIRVMDSGQNIDPNAIETLVIRIATSSGDVIVMRLYESGPNTGAFYGYVPSARDPTPSGDPVLTAPSETQLTATYVDAFDASEVSVDTALVDPFGRVFDSLTGEAINGVAITIVDTATGQPAQVFGADGVSTYPSTILTGSPVTDSSGLTYTLQPGEFLFPLMAPGNYRLDITAPAGYFYPSAFTADDFQDLPGAPYVIVPASYGGTFTLTASGPLNFDVPLDGAGEIFLTKTALQSSAAAGDTVLYAIEIENRDRVPAPVIVRDTLPEGLRYVAQSARISSGTVDVSTNPANGREIEFRAGVLRPGESLRLTYAAALTAGVRPGVVVNRAVGVNHSGEPISNRSEATLEIVEDLLRSRLTLIGRVAEGACAGTDEWARDLKDGAGVPGVRLYMENGTYVVSDENGLFHFEGVLPGTHVVQIDEKTLPEGYRPMVCEENSRYARSPTSKFIDVRPGLIWRANFYLERYEIVEKAEDFADFDDTVEYQNYDQAWLETAPAEIRWIYPETQRTPSSRSVNAGILHPKRHTATLFLNGQIVPATNFSGRDSAEHGPAEISRWRGIDILSGENHFRAEVRDENGKIVRTLNESIWHVADVQRARLVADQTHLMADGRTVPILAIRFEDSAGRPVHKGRIVRVDITQPYALKRVEQFEREQAVTAFTANTGSVVGSDGIARIALEPTLKTGRVRARVELDNGQFEEIIAWMLPEKRDWILVGLGEGTLANEKLKGPGPVSDTPDGDGRVAFFAKGMIKGDWLLTLAVDTAKRRGSDERSLFEGHIDPNAYYTLYGDRTWQQSDAESRYPVYVKLEKRTAQVLFGDFDTDLADTSLGLYARRFSGLKASVDGTYASFTGFAAESGQAFVKDEIAADGTSGPYRLSRRNIVRNAEVVRVETRDRLRPDQILDLRAYTRWIDYEIDYATGEIIFRHPVDAVDAGFNPRVIVVDYETLERTADDITAGGRASVHSADRRFEAGATYIHEAAGQGNASQLGAIDVKAKLTETLEVRAEAAATSRDDADGKARANAWLVEARRQGEALTVTGYAREEEAGFGLGQQGSNTDSIRRIGAEASLRISGEVDKEGASRLGRYLEGRAYREQSLTSGAKRDAVEAVLRQETANAAASIGVKSVHESYPLAGESRDSVLLTGSVRKTFAGAGVTLTASHEQPIDGGQDGATLFPQRTLIGIDKTLNEMVTLNLRHEVSNGENASGEMTTIGATVHPWTGAEVRATADRVTEDSATRLAATVGLDQTFKISDAWSASLGAARRARIDGGDVPLDVTPDAALSPLEDGLRSPLANDEAFTSAYVGLGYRAEKSAGSARVEVRDAENGKRWTAAAGAARESSEKFSYGLAARWQDEASENLPARESFEARLGSAFRPRGEGAVIYNRLDVKAESLSGEFESRKIVNNLAVNLMLTDQTQLAVSWGLKWQENKIGAIDTQGTTQLIAGEIRHDITESIDVGFSGSMLADHATDTRDYSFGPSVGFTPAENVWFSAGYDMSGFDDRDFEAAEYSRDGPYVKLRVKFDQKTAEGFLKRISPSE